MKSIICIKIGENEHSTYAKFDKLYKHLDIVDVFPPKYDDKGNLRGMGVQGDKEFLGIVADFGDITDEEFQLIRNYLREMDVTQNKDAEGKVTSTTMNKRRLHKVDLNSDLKTALSLTKTHTDKIAEFATKRQNKEEIDMREINDYKKVVDFTDLAKSILHKDKAKYAYENLELSTKSLKNAIASEKVKNGNGNIDNK